MRLRIALLTSALTALASVAVPAVVNAAPHHNRGLTINATPDPTVATDGVLIYGQLNDPPVAGQKIVLYHHVAGTHTGFTRVGSTTTDAHGFYEFVRADGIVETNRQWFVKEAGAKGVHSRTVYEKVAALVTICASTPTPAPVVCQSSISADTRHPVVFTGHVTANHAGERVLLQVQSGANDDWTTLKTGRLGPGSNYRIALKWSVPGNRDVRVVFPKQDARNETGSSDAVSVTIQQAQVPGFTINTSQQIIPEGQSATISGVLDMPGTTTPEPTTVVTLYARRADQSHFVALASTPTGTDGSYSFTEQPAVNTLYQVRTGPLVSPKRHTAVLFEGVKDVVTMTASATTSTVGGTVTFNGTISPTTKVGHWVYLQLQNAAGDWHSVEAVRIGAGSTFQFAYSFARPGTYKFRARKFGDERNVGAVSTPVTVTVTGTAPLGSLPPAS